jgi:hypothetical protein
MQEIKIQSITPPYKGSHLTRDRFYYVNIPTKRFTFSSKKEALAFLASINRDLNELAHALNRLTAETYSEFRYYYFHLTSADRSSCEQNFTALNKMFNMLITRSAGVNGNHFTFVRFNNIFGYLIATIVTLERHSMNRLATVQRYRLKALKTSIDMLKMQLDSIGENMPFEKFENH